MASEAKRDGVLGREPSGAVDKSVEMRAEARVGTSLRGKWRLDELLGIGGMAAVYAATHRNGSRAAVKVLHLELALVPDARTRFTREGYVANAVGHEGAVRVLDDDVAEDGSLFLVTELLSGETLEQRRVRLGGVLSEDEVLAAADQLLDVLVAAHDRGIVHRDIKPDNLFLTQSGQVKVLDFGIARMREITSESQATRHGESMGTPAFMPPEQARGRWDEVDATSDLWACGATMFTLLSGELVHDAETVNEVLLSAMTQAAPPLSTVAPSVSRRLCAIVDRALAVEKERRWPSAAGMQKEVREAYVERHGAPITTAPKLVPPAASAAASTSSSPRAPGAGAGGGAETVEPVAHTGAGPRTISHPSVRALAGLAVAVVVLGGVFVWRARAPSPTAAPTVASAPSIASAPPVASPPEAVSLAPEPTATSLAPAPGERRPRRPGSSPVPGSPPIASAATSSTSAPPVAGACNPPFTVDAATGKKRWKPECL